MKINYILTVLITLGTMCNLSNAMFLSKETNLQKIDDEIHKRALPFKNKCCTLYIPDESGSLKYSTSGGLIGIRNDNSLCILTSAHTVYHDYDPSRPVTDEILANFDVEAGSGITMSDFFKVTKFYTLPSITGYGTFMEPDIAILICQPDVRAADMESFSLYSGQGHKQAKSMEAAFVGFGPCYDKDGNDVNPNKRRLRLGYTHVFHAPFKTQITLFQNWLLAAPNWTKNGFWNMGYNPIVMNPTVEPDIGLETGKLNLNPHPKQAFITWGYGGSPLLFNTSRGFEVAGIASSHFFANSTGSNGQINPVLLTQNFYPVMPHASWIDSVIKDQIYEKETLVYNLKKRENF